MDKILCKTIKKQFDNSLTFKKMLEANERASVGKRLKQEIILFDVDFETNIVKIINDLKNENYKFGNYREFIIYEPKERIIKSLPYRDRIVHQWYIHEFIKPFYYKRFIRDTYACIDNRGAHKAVIKIQKNMIKMKKDYGNYYILKCDIKKFFYSINRKILFNILSKDIKDEKLLTLTKKIINVSDEKGIPIGNYTSQFFANIYMNELDHYVKEKLKIKYYVRYMDDFILLIPTKTEAIIIKEKIESFINNELDLEFNQKTRYYSSKFGLDFCGYKIFENYRLLRKRFKKKIKKNINIWNRLNKNNILDCNKMNMSFNSSLAHMNYCNSYNFKMKLYKKINFKDNLIESNKIF